MKQQARCGARGSRSGQVQARIEVIAKGRSLEREEMTTTAACLRVNGEGRDERGCREVPRGCVGEAGGHGGHVPSHHGHMTDTWKG